VSQVDRKHSAMLVDSFRCVGHSFLQVTWNVRCTHALTSQCSLHDVYTRRLSRRSVARSIAATVASC